MVHQVKPLRTVVNPLTSGVLLAVSLIAGHLLTIHGYNVNLRTAKVMVGPADVSFGYSIRMTTDLNNSNNPGYYVSAPKSATPLSSGTNKNPGLVFACPLSAGKDTDCTVLYDKTEDYYNDTFRERFGSSMSLLDSSKSFLVCSPATRDTSLEKQHFHFMPGSCSLLDLSNDKAQPKIEPFRNRGEYTSNLPDGGKTNKYGYASFGMAAESDQRSVFVVSAPGIHNGEGLLYFKDTSQGREDYQITDLKLVNNLVTTAYRYLGYSLKMGDFCTTNGDCVAAGAPAESTPGKNPTTGAVHIFKWIRSLGAIMETDVILGEQPWAFFGASLAAVDFDKDGLDELIVGAPYHMDVDPKQAGKASRFDQGRVFIYARTKDRKSKYSLIQTLSGSKAKYARFGFSVQGIGDLNLDEIPDLAVGAPWEDEGLGCIYIYFGHGNGVTETFTQRISPGELPTNPPKGLGFAISNYIMPSGDSFPSFAATSVSGNAVVTFTGRPIVNAVVKLYSDNKVSADSDCGDPDITGPCFQVTVWIGFSTKGKKIYNLDFNVTLSIDTLVPSSKRVLFRQPDGSNAASISLMGTRVNHKGTNFTNNAVILVPQMEQNIVTPIGIRAEYELLDKHKSHPILNQMTPHEETRTISFTHLCGDNNICDVDLKTHGSLSYLHKGSENYTEVIVNATTALMVNLQVSNQGETSYMTVLTLTSELPYLRGPATCREEESQVDCEHRILREGEKFALNLEFDTAAVPLDKKYITVDARAMPQDLSQSKDKNPEDNSMQLKTEVAIITKVILEGSSLPSEVTANQSRQIPLTTKVDIDESFLRKDLTGPSVNVTHRALMRNIGPSFLPTTNIHVAVPYFSLDGFQVMQNATVKLYMASGLQINCVGTFKFNDDHQISTETTTTSTTTTTPKMVVTTAQTAPPTTQTMAKTTTEFIIDGGGINKRKRRSADKSKSKLSAVYTMSCKTDPQFCKHFTCALPTILSPGEYATIDISMSLEEKHIPIPKDFNLMYFTTSIQVAEPDHFLLRPWASIPEINLVTIFHPVKQGETINFWIIIGSVAGGLVLIVIIALILWKIGFFKRDQNRHQVQRWKRESKRRSRAISGRS